MSDGNYVLITNTSNHLIHQIIISTAVVSTFADYSAVIGTTDGYGTNTRFNLLSRIVFSKINTTISYIITDRNFI